MSDHAPRFKRPIKVRVTNLAEVKLYGKMLPQFKIALCIAPSNRPARLVKASTLAHTVPAQQPFNGIRAPFRPITQSEIIRDPRAAFRRLMRG